MNNTKLNTQILQAMFRTYKKTIQEYVREIERHCRFKSSYRYLQNGTVMDDRGRLIDLYDACIQQDAHLAGVLETLKSQIIGERYMLARQNDKGRYIKDVSESKKIQGTQFNKIIQAIIEVPIYGYSGIEIKPDIDPMTGKLACVNTIERRNILPDQRRIVLRQGLWTPGWSFDDPMYSDHFILLNNGTLGLGSSFTPIILAKKFTMANYVNFSHTYGQPIIHGKTDSEIQGDKQRLANEIAGAAQNKVIVTGLDDEVDIKSFTMSNSEHIFTGLIALVDKDVSNLILGSETMSGGMQSYVGSTKAHENIFRDRIEVYRDFIENTMNEQIIPRLVKMGYIAPGLEFKYAKRIEMSDEDRIKLFQVIGSQWEMDPDTIESEFGIKVKKQLNVMTGSGAGGSSSGGGRNGTGRRLTDEEYFKRYGRHRDDTVNFLTEGQ